MIKSKEELNKLVLSNENLVIFWVDSPDTHKDVIRKIGRDISKDVKGVKILLGDRNISSYSEETIELITHKTMKLTENLKSLYEEYDTE
jgi:hypothetical protein|tara:strand:- start:193 stop:459 length:267 start_codon:yes stop_codon:yes gene_type:complete